jgi:chaperonin cofactor prefoldin
MERTAEDWAQDQRYDALKKRVEDLEKRTDAAAVIISHMVEQLQSLENRLAPFEPLLRFLESLKGK